MRLLLVPELLGLPNSCRQPVPTTHNNRDTPEERLNLNNGFCSDCACMEIRQYRKKGLINKTRVEQTVLPDDTSPKVGVSCENGKVIEPEGSSLR